MVEEKYCVDCKFFRNSNFSTWCESPKLGKSLVTGETMSRFASITMEGQCRGHWFEQKEVPPPKKKWYQRLF